MLLVGLEGSAFFRVKTLIFSSKIDMRFDTAGIGVGLTSGRLDCKNTRKNSGVPQTCFLGIRNY